jgi:hypothetical protein
MEPAGFPGGEVLADYRHNGIAVLALAPEYGRALESGSVAE